MPLCGSGCGHRSRLPAHRDLELWACPPRFLSHSSCLGDRVCGTCVHAFGGDRTKWAGATSLHHSLQLTCCFSPLAVTKTRPAHTSPRPGCSRRRHRTWNTQRASAWRGGPCAHVCGRGRGGPRWGLGCGCGCWTGVAHLPTRRGHGQRCHAPALAGRVHLPVQAASMSQWRCQCRVWEQDVRLGAWGVGAGGGTCSAVGRL